jgi:hypothetical protein
LSDKPNNNDENYNPSSGDVFYDLLRDDGHLKAKTEKQVELEEKAEKREREMLVARDVSALNPEKVPEEPKKTTEKENDKENYKENKQIEKVEKSRKPAREFQEVKLNQQNVRESKTSTTTIQGIDAEIQDRIKQKKLARKDTSSAISDAGSAGTIRTPSPTPAVNKSQSQGIKK